MHTITEDISWQIYLNATEFLLSTIHYNVDYLVLKFVSFQSNYSNVMSTTDVFLLIYLGFLSTVLVFYCCLAFQGNRAMTSANLQLNLFLSLATETCPRFLL